MEYGFNMWNSYYEQDQVRIHLISENCQNFLPIYYKQDQVRIHLKSENCQNFSLLEGLSWAGSGEDSFEIGKLSEFLATGRSIMSRIRWGFIWNLKTTRSSCYWNSMMSGIRWGFIWNRKTVRISCSKRWNSYYEQDKVRIHLKSENCQHFLF